MCACIFQFQKAIADVTIGHHPLEEQVDQHYSRCDHVYLHDSPGTQITNPLRQALSSLFTGEETKAQ